MSNKKDGLFGGLLLFTGALIGAATALLIKEERPMKAGLVLEKVKKHYGHQGEVTASWIDYDPIEYDALESKPLVYRGGVTLTQEGKNIQYQFASDIYTGEIINDFIMASHEK